MEDARNALGKAYAFASYQFQNALPSPFQQITEAVEHVSNYTVPDGVSYGPVTFSGSDHAAVSTVRFRSYDPATHQFTESSPINVGTASGNG